MFKKIFVPFVLFLRPYGSKRLLTSLSACSKNSLNTSLN